MNWLKILSGYFGLGKLKHAFTWTDHEDARGYLTALLLIWVLVIPFLLIFPNSLEIVVGLAGLLSLALGAIFAVNVRVSWTMAYLDPAGTVETRLTDHLVYLYVQLNCGKHHKKDEFLETLYCFYWFYSIVHGVSRKSILMKKVYEILYTVEFSGKRKNRYTVVYKQGCEEKLSFLKFETSNPDNAPAFEFVPARVSLRDMSFLESSLKELILKSIVRMHSKNYSKGAVNQMATWLTFYTYLKNDPLEFGFTSSWNFDDILDQCRAINGTSLDAKFDINLIMSPLGKNTVYIIQASNWGSHLPTILVLPY